MAHGGGSGKGAIEAFTMFVAKFIFLWHLHLFIAARILLACVFRELGILMCYE